METNVSPQIFRWRILRAFSLLWLALTLIVVTLLLPTALVLFALIVVIFSGLTGGIAVLTYNSKLSIISLVTAFGMFLDLLGVEITSKTVESNLPLTLLGFVMLLFAVESLTATTKRPFFEIPERGRQVPISLMDRFIEQSFTRTSRVAILFATCYLISMSTVYLSAYAALFQPALADVSLYVIVVSISLALLILLRED